MSHPNVTYDDEVIGQVSCTVGIRGEIYETKDFNDEDAALYWARKDGASSNRGRCWCFTLNNPPEGYEQHLETIFPDIEYMVVGREIAPNTKTFHLQGFVVFTNPKSFGMRGKNGSFGPKSLKGLLPEAHWSKMRSTAKKCIEYCIKDADVFTIGKVPAGQGAREDLRTICDKIMKSGFSIDDMYDQYPEYMVRMSRGFNELFAFMSKPRDEKPFCNWFYGGTGVGKSEFATLWHHPDDIYRKTDGSKYWMGYAQQPVVVIEEFRLKSKEDEDGWKFEDFLQILDKYPIPVHLKGYHAKFNSPIIYITSSQHPSKYFRSHYDFVQVLRRLTMIYHLEDAESDPIPQTKYNDSYWNADMPPPRRRTIPGLEEKISLMTSAKRLRVVGIPIPQSQPIVSESEYDDEI